MRTRSEVKRPSKEAELKLSSTRKNQQHIQASSSTPRHLKQAQASKRGATISPKQHDAGVRNQRLMSPRSRNIVHTPGRDDVLCSQHFDSQIVVGWDCNSPDTLRGIKRISGPDHDDVSDLVMRLIGQETDDDVFTKRSTPPLLGVWKEDTEDKLLDDNNVVAHRLRRNRGRQRRKSGKESAVSKDLLSKLSLALDKCTEAAEGEEEQREAGGEILEAGGEIFLKDDESTKQHNCSDDLFNSESNDFEVKSTRNPSRYSDKKNSSVELKNNTKDERNSCTRFTNNKNKEQDLNLKTCEIEGFCDKIDNQIRGKTEVDEENWSDDELFEEDSFIVKATQVSTDVKKFVSPVFSTKRKTPGDVGLPKSKCSRYSFQLGADDEKDKHNVLTTGKFTYLQNKQTDSNLSSLSKGNEQSVSKPNTQHSMVTKCGNRKPPVYQPVLPVRTTCSQVKPNTGAQVFSSCANPVPAKSGAIVNNKNIPLTRQRTCTSSNSVNINYKGPVVSKPTNTHTSNAFTSVPFKKHNSFSGSGSQNLVSSRRRSVSGDKLVEQGTGLKNFYGGMAGCNAVKSCTARTYSTVSTTNMASNTVINSTARTYPAVSTTNMNSSTVKNTTARTYPTACNTSAISNPIKNNIARTHSTVCNTNITGHPVRNSIARTYPTVSSTSLTSNKSSVPSTNYRSHPAETPKKERKRSSVGSFDTSISDDLLCQLAEPDDILDSQSDITLTVTPVTYVPTPNTRVPSAITKTSDYCVDNKHPVKQYTFKQSQKKSTSPVGSKECKKLKGAVTDVPGIAVNKKDSGNVLEQYSEDLFASDDDDDMLLADDDGLTEPQILAMLDEVEMLATQQFNSQRSNQVPSDSAGVQSQSVGKTLKSNPGKTSISNPVQDCKSSQRQSVENYGTTDNGTDLIGSQGQLAGSQGHLEGSQGQLAGSQDQLAGSQGQLAGSQGHSNSQSKYSPAEIERKKQEAMERRKLKLKKV